MSQVIPILVCIDVEPDLRNPNPKNPIPWKGYEVTYKFFKSLRDEASQVTGSSANFSWFFRMDPQVGKVYGSTVWPATRYPTIINELRDQGDELGLHTHFSRWDDTSDNWVIDYQNQEWIQFCIQTALDAYHQVFNKPCDSFRFGNRWLSNDAIAFLEKMGVKFDLTLEPDLEGAGAINPKELTAGHIPDYLSAPRIPYRPNFSNFAIPDPHRQDGLIMIPLSTANLSGLPALAFRYYQYMVRGHYPKQVYVTLNPLLPHFIFRHAMNQLIYELQQPYIALVLRSEISNNFYYLRNIRKNFTYLFSHPSIKRFVFSTPHQVMESLGLLNVVTSKENVTCRG